MVTPIHVHPLNTKIFEFRGKPLTLVTATEHYGAVMNRPFNIELYLEDMAMKHMTLTRLFLLFRELQSPNNPNSTCKPDSSDYVTPFQRTGPGRAVDGEPKFDLDLWNPEYFERLHRFMSKASLLGVIVEVTLLSNTYGDTVWALNPLYGANNVNDIPSIPWPEYISLRHPEVVNHQRAYIVKVVEELNPYDNFYFEICNEPGGGVDLPGSPTCEEVDAWQVSIANLIRSTEAHLPSKHLIAGQEAFHYNPMTFTTDTSFHSFPIDVVNVHPLPNTVYGNRHYDLGQFMSKQLRLRELRDYCLATFHEPRPLNMDEDNIASQYIDLEGWTIHRKRAWTALMSGAHYDYIDFTVNKYVESGSHNSHRTIRSWMGYLADFIHSLDIVHARPLASWLKAQPQHTLACVYAMEGEDYSIYLADERELEETGYGDPINGSITCDLPASLFEVACYQPMTGVYSVWLPLPGGPDVKINLPEFRHDLVIRIRRPH